MGSKRPNFVKMRMGWSIIVIVIGLYLALVALMFLLQDRMMYLPLRAIGATPAERGLAYEEVRIETSDGVELAGWFVPALPERGVVLFFHGNAGNISHRLDSLEVFHDLGVSTLIFDYRGYGQSQGRPSEQGTYLDAEAAWRYLVEEWQVPAGRMFFFGRSLGGAVATYLAQVHPPRALILESTFTSAPDIAAHHLPFVPARPLVRFRYDTLARLPGINCPVLVVHSPDDEVIPYSHGRRLFAAAPEPKEFLEIHGGHNEGFLVSANYRAGLEMFIARYAGGAEK